MADLPAPAASKAGAAIDELLSAPLNRREYVELHPVDKPQVVHCHPALRLLTAEGRQPEHSAEEWIGPHLGRIVDGDVSGARPAARRFVEPGVGRSCVAADIVFSSNDTPPGWPAAADFLLTGTGLTPYGAAGFVNVGRRLDGRLSLTRALYRKDCAERLSDAGCRTSLAVATLKLPGRPIDMPDGSVSAPAVLLRAFRSLVRVKQLDPIACALHSARHGLLALQYVLAEADRRLGATLPRGDVLRCALARAFEHYGPAELDLPALLGDIHASGAHALIRQIRLAIIQQAAAPLLARTVATLRAVRADADDDGRLDPDRLWTYSHWFSRQLGRQLGLFKQQRFLHDYHYPGIRRNGAWVYSLVENNVTLAAEFADLETGVFVDADIEHIRHHIQLSTDEILTLRRHYAALHQRDVQAAARVAHTLDTIVRLLCPHGGGAAQRVFAAAYRQASK
ncbi:hypothetical protein H7U20_14810 [Rugamonas sp. CCM 8940]|uniref:hypothetical protein n=1 Tax=Rugamonas sp. CCM 8940 TaxID=2765359 RepID=UPI001A360549|nr:hypothetical protein [Rugamonas sp. CCM 8940]MBJ7311455.1 hypothetical protein [Rugamonas sp. CCM 8940]